MATITNPRHLAVGDRPALVGPINVVGHDRPRVISLGNGLIKGIDPIPTTPHYPDQPTHLAFPSFAEPHLHPDRAFVGSPRPPRSLEDAIELGVRPAGFVADTAGERAHRLFSALAANGATRARGHLGHLPKAIAPPRWPAIGEVRTDLADRIEIELVAFAVEGTLTDADELQRLRRDLNDGRYQMLGGSPNHDSNPQGAVTAIMEIASQTGVEVDIHIDETLDPTRLLMSFALDEVERCNLAGQVSFSHCCLLSALPEAQTRALARRMAGLGVTVNSMPRTNLILHEYGNHSPRRALAPINLLVEEGVHVRLGVDNVDDTFCPFPTADLLDIGYLARLAGHFYDDAQLVASLSDGRSTIGKGESADLTLVEAKTINEALARRPRRVTMRAGAVVASGNKT
jgi:cytosine deaminase